MIFAFVDANIFVRVVSQGRPGCEHAHFADLKTLVEGDVLQLLVPEVLLLELEKLFRLLPRHFESHCDKLGNAVTKATEDVWNEIDALKTGLLDQITTYKKGKLSDCERISTEIMQFLRSAKLKRIDLSAQIWLDVQRRLIAGRLPVAKPSSNQDAAIVESLVSFCRSLSGSQHQRKRPAAPGVSPAGPWGIA